MISKTDRRICGTCEYWTGERKPIFDRNGIPKINIIDDYGVCNHATSVFVDEQRRKNLNCKNFSKWTEIL